MQKLTDRTKQFALKVIRFTETFTKNDVMRVISNQLLRSATSVGANYRAALRAKSKADFISKMGTVEEESDEVAYWLELLLEMDKVNKEEVTQLLKENNEITAIVVSSIKTAKGIIKR